MFKARYWCKRTGILVKTGVNSFFAWISILGRQYFENRVKKIKSAGFYK